MLQPRIRAVVSNTEAGRSEKPEVRVLQLWHDSGVLEMAHCVRWSVIGGLLGLAAVAWGQSLPDDAAVAIATADPSAAALVELVKGAGLPGVLAMLGWWLRGITQQGLSLTIRLADDDRDMLRDALKKE